MFYNYLITALQNLRNQPVFSAIKVLSLTLGLVCSVLVLMHVQYIFSYDKNFPNWQNIYRVVSSTSRDYNMTAEPYAPQMSRDYPQIEYIAKIRPSSGLFSRDNEVSENEFFWVEPDVIDLFSLEFSSGDPATALDEPNAIVLNESTAKKYFGNEDPIGQLLTLDSQLDLEVTGVLKDLPSNTYLDFTALIAVATGQQMFGPNFMENNAWILFQGTQTFFMAPNKAEAEAIADDLGEFLERNIPEQGRSYADQVNLSLSLEPLSEVYMSPRGGYNSGGPSRARIFYGLVLFALLILVTSCINFVNLSLSQARQRGKEVGVRKTLGATSSQIVTQFLFESMILTLLALVVALPFIYLAIPVYTNLTDTAFTALGVLQSSFIFWLSLFVVATGLVSGIVPALSLAHFQPAAILSGKISNGRASGLIRSAITVFQFSLSTTLVILAIGIMLLVDHLNNMAMGFNKDNLVILDSTFSSRNAEEFNYDAMVNELARHAGVVSVAKSMVSPPNTGGSNPWQREGWQPDENRLTSHYGVDEKYLDTFQFQLLAGRGFSLDFPADFLSTAEPDPEQTYGAVITQAAATDFGFESPEVAIDELLLFSGLRFRIIGVIGDFRLSGGIEDILRSTSVLWATHQPQQILNIRIDPDQTEEALDHIDTVWSQHRPDIPINRSFYEQIYNDLISERTNGVNKASLFAAVITIIISALGLYALAFYSSQSRTKEIGVRKVLGATSSSIMKLLVLDFVKPVFVACLVSWITGYYAINFFFAQFSSRPEISVSIYFGVSVGIILLAIFTVAMQCYRTANADPVKSLRYE